MNWTHAEQRARRERAAEAIRWSARLRNVFAVTLVLLIAVGVASDHIPSSWAGSPICKLARWMAAAVTALSFVGMVAAFLAGATLEYSADTADGSVSKMLARGSRKFGSDVLDFTLRHGLTIVGLETIIYWGIRWSGNYAPWWMLFPITILMMLMLEFGLLKPARDKEWKEKTLRHRGLLVIFKNLGEGGIAKNLNDPLATMKLSNEQWEILGPMTASEKAELIRELGFRIYQRDEYIKAQGIGSAA